MDILHLVDRLEELFNESRSLPFTRDVIVNEDRMLDIIDQMRVSIPEEIRKAQQVVAQKERLMAQAAEEATRTLSLAREKGDQLLEREGVTQAANSRAEQIIAQARLESERFKRDADDYVLNTLVHLEAELEHTLGEVRKGLTKLQEDRAAQAAAAENKS
jgi:hypothetical protein